MADLRGINIPELPVGLSGTCRICGAQLQLTGRGMVREHRSIGQGGVCRGSGYTPARVVQEGQQ